MDERKARPILLTVGIVTTLVTIAFTVASLAVAAFGLATLTVVGIANARGDDAVPVAIGGTLGGFLVSCLLLFYALKALVCWGAWRQSRVGLIALAVLAGLSLCFEILTGAGAGCCCCLVPIFLAIHVITLVGCLQALSARSA